MKSRKILFIALILAKTTLGAEPKLSLEWKRLAPSPNSAGVAAPFAGTSGGALIVAGGANFPNAKPWEGGKKVWHDEVFVLEQPDAQWKRAGHLPRRLAYGVSVSDRDEIICVGGSDEKQHHADVFALTWNGRNIATRTLPSLPRPIANACGAVLDRTLYIAGGQLRPDATNALASFFALNLDDKKSQWRELPPWPGTPRMLATAAVQDGAFFVVGGVELFPGESGKPTRRYLRDGFRYDPKGGWRRLADLPFPVAAAPSPAPGVGRNHFLILGADDGSRAALPASPTHPGFNAEVLSYDTESNSWTRIATSPAPRVTVPAISWRDRWIIPSGEMQPGVRSPEVWSVGVSERSAGL